MAKKDKTFDKLRDAGKLDQYNEIVGNLDQTSNNTPGKNGDRVPARTFEGKTAPVADVVHWVAENLAVQDVKASNASSASAWAMKLGSGRGLRAVGRLRRGKKAIPVMMLRRTRLILAPPQQRAYPDTTK